MGKIVMPKNSALLEEIEPVLEIYYNANDWLDNDTYKKLLKEKIGGDQYASSYTKKAQITSYFGFTEWSDINNKRSLRRITPSGKKMYEALISENNDKIQDILMDSLEKTTFGRNNYGCPESNSDIEPPSLFIRAILDLGYLTYSEFAYLLWGLANNGGNYTDVLEEVKSYRSHEAIPLEDGAEKYKDCKPIMVLVRWGFLEEEENSGANKRIVVSKKVMEKYEIRLRNLKVYNIDKDIYPNIEVTEEEIIIKEEDRLTTGCNVLLYGVPGSGKSWTIEHEYCSLNTHMERIVFHPDYTNADFIGQLLPVVDDAKQVSYEFKPGPFTKILQQAYANPTKEYVLIIEEINRGNAASIFGDIFQLLDRFSEENSSFPIGTSRYGIINENIATFVYGISHHEIRIPSNLSVIGTMNTSDQNVFVLDTAFQRRWQMRLIENNFDTVRDSLANAEILDTEVTWQRFCTTINRLIIGSKNRLASAEDKRLGVYFIHENDLRCKGINFSNADFLSEYTSLIKLESANAISPQQEKRLKELRGTLKQLRIFPEKVLKYLWDDAFKFNPEVLFDLNIVDNLEDIVRIFIFSNGRDRFKIFNSTIRDQFYKLN